MTLAGTRGPEVRRRVGPVAWCALECLAGRPVVDGAVEASVRSIADELGVAKNTAHRAIATLARAGLVEAMQGRAGNGRYGGGRYRLRVDGLFADPPSMSKPSAQRKTPTPVAPEQLTLLPNP